MQFADVLRSVRQGAQGWSAEVTDDWLQGRTVFGGLQVALAVHALRGLVDPALPLRSLQVTFVAPLPCGSVGIKPGILRVGRSVTHASCALNAGSELTTMAIAIFGAARDSAFEHSLRRPDAGVEPGALQDMAIPDGIGPQFVHHFRMRWARGTPPYTGYHEPDTLIFARMRDPGDDPEAALIALADCIPSPVVSMYSRPVPASTMNWTLDVLADPRELVPGEWSTISTAIRAGAAGYASQTSVLWSASGAAMSASHQTVGIFD